jgi:outer membrane protein OmpA-like peptidoglycan-associated protein
MDSPTAPATATAVGQAPDASAGETAGAWVVDHQRVRRPLGALFWLAAFVVPLGLTAGVVITRTPVLEHDLHAEAVHALRQAGMGKVRVVMDGREVLAKVPSARSTARAEATLRAVPGIETVQAVSVYASKAEAKACRSMQGKLDRVTDAQRIPFLGSSARLTSSASSMLRHVAQLLRACRSAIVVIGGHTDSHTVNGSSISLARARAMARALKGQGIAARRLVPRGYGDQYPIADGATAGAQARNQRGSVVIQEP